VKSSRRLLAAAIALAMAAPGPGFAAGVARVQTGPTALAPVLGAPALQAPVLSAPALLLSPASLASTLTPAPSLVPSALRPVVPAAAKADKPSPRAALDGAAAQAAKLTPKTGAAESKAGAGRAFEGPAERREVASFVSARDAAPATPAPLETSRRAAPAAKAVPPLPASKPTLASRARRFWPAAAALGAAALLYAFGPEAASGVLPLLGLAGTLGWTPTPGAKAAFLAGIRDAAAPGTVISYAKVGEIGARLGMDAEKAGETFTELVQEGHIAIRDNRDAVYHSFRARAEAPGAHPADALASNAAVLMNSGSSSDHARAVAKAERAVAAYEAAGLPQLEEAKVLRGNATLEFVSGLLLAHQKDLESRDPLPFPLAKRAMEVAEVREWLQTATYQNGRPLKMPERVHRKLVALVGSLNPQAESGDPAAEEVADGYIAALDLLETFDPRDYLFEGAAKGPAHEGAWTPSAEQVAAFAAEVRARTAPGETLTRETIMRAGRSLDLDVRQMSAAVTALAERGEVLVLANGKTVYFDLRDQAESDRDGLWELHNEAVDAIKLLNEAGLENHLKAVARLDALHHRYFDARARLSAEAKAYQQVLIALANAKLEAAAGVVRHQAEARKGDEARLAGIRQAQAWLDHAYYSAERRQRITTASHKALDAAASLPAFRDALGGHTEPLITQGVMQTRHFLGDMTAEDDEAADRDAPAPHPSGWRPLAPAEFPALTKYGIDLTGKAIDGKIPPMIGRKAEMRQIVKTLLRVEKNNPLIIGEKGVGKTAVANGLALLIAKGEIPELEGKSVVKLDLTKIVAGTTLRGQFEERMVAILDEAKKSNGRVVLFIDEIHMLVGAGDSEGSTDAANILKESLSDGSISVIGATTMEEYRKIEKDGALARRFNAVKLLPPTKDEAEAIVEGVKSRYEVKHTVTIGAETVKAVVALASRYITDRNLPDSALDLLDDASAEAELSRRSEVLPADIANEVALRTGIPAGKLGQAEKDQLKDLPGDLGNKVVGQAEAVAKVAKGVQRGRMGLRNVKQPIGSFIFLGPTGVGKTEIARQTAKTVFGSEKNMVRLDMSEYMEKHSVSRMIGAPPGYVGFDQAGQLTEAVRRNPYSVILLDEIEKAHPEVLDVLLQVIEDGRLTDGQGRTVDFSNTIIMMTSNIGGSLAGEDAEPKRRPMGFVTREETPEEPAAGTDARRAKYLAALKAKLRPEFINRVGEDGIVIFNELGAAELESILTLRVKDLEDQLKERGVTVTLSAEARTEILKRAEAQKAYGARPLKQIVERQLSDAIVSAELEGRIAEGDAVVIGWDGAAFTASKK